MTTRKVLVWPHEGLRVVAQPVEDITSPEVRAAAEDLKDTIAAYNAHGLAATQIGIPLHMLAYREDSGGVVVLVNTKITSTTGDFKSTEGCLSFPGVMARIPRKFKVTASGTTMYGNNLDLELEGVEAVALQHELDHLNGVVMLDHMGPTEKRMALKRLKKIKKRLGAYV